MFPQIAKKKKKEVEASDFAYKEWEELNKELDHRARLAIKKIPNALLHDFSKICRIKSIPDFYANYFLLYSHKSPEEELARLFSQQMENILTNRSYFHRINQVLKDREEVLTKIKQSLLIVEGFMLMNQGKNIPLATRGTIQELVEGCQTLEQLRLLERKKAEDLANFIILSRNNSVKLIDEIVAWRSYLEGFTKGDASYLKKMKIIYPHKAINCLLLLFYDTEFIKTPILKSEIVFGKEEEDPFFQKLTKYKKGGQIQNYICQSLKADQKDYKQYVTRLKQQIPSAEADQIRQLELEREKELQRVRAQKLKQQKEREQKVKEMREQKQKKKVQRYSSLKALRVKKQGEVDKQVRHKTARAVRSEKKIINIDALLRQKSLKKEKEQTNKDDLKIIGVYQKIGKPVKGMQVDKSVLSNKQEQIKQHKKVWQKEIKEEQQEKEKIKRLLKQTQKRALAETKQFEEKLKKYEEEVANLKSRIDSAKKGRKSVGSSDKSKRSPVVGKKSIVSVYGVGSKQQKGKGSTMQVLQSKLTEQSKLKRNLQLQMKQLSLQKSKLEQQLQKESSKISKETSHFQKKIQKYEETILKLKEQAEHNKKIIKNLEQSKNSEEKKTNQNLRMYTLQKKEEEMKKKIIEQINIREQKRKLRDSRVQVESRRKKQKQEELDKSISRSQKSLKKGSGKDLEIVKTKQTIEIVFQVGRKKKKEPPNKELLEAEQKLLKLQKQRELLQKKLQMSSIGKDDKKKVFQSKLTQNQKRVERFREQFQRQKDRNFRLQQNIRQMRKSINNQLQTRLSRQRIKFEREKEELLRTIQKEKEEKYNKDKILEQQMKFLKEMQKNEEQLIGLLDLEKKQKKEKERRLAEEIERKEELMNLMEIEEIKKTIEREVRKELLESEDEGEEDVELIERKQKMEEEIERLKMERDQEINELDDHNEKLKELINRIKGEENQLLEAIRENIDLQSESEIDSNQKIRTMSEGFKLQQKKQEPIQDIPPMNTDDLTKQLQRKTLLQYRSEEKKRKEYSDIEKSSVFKEKEKIENLVEFYLKSPHQYPGERSAVLQKEEKAHFAQELQSKTKLIQQFQNQLFAVKDLPDYVPSLKNNSINSHFLNLREAYQNYQADALRRQLFPPLREDEEIYNAKQLSVESEEQPIVTMMDDVKAHQKKYSPKKKEDKKNFLSINRMRLMLLEQDRKQKQRQMVEQQSRKKVQRMAFDKNRKKREQKMIKKKERQDKERAQRIKSIEKSIEQRRSRSRESKQLSERSSKSRKHSQEKSIISDKSKSSRQSNRKSMVSKIKNKKTHSQRERSQSQSEKEKDILSDSQKSKSSISKQVVNEDVQKIEKKTEIMVIKEEQIEHSLDKKQEEEMQKMERAILVSQIKSVQSQVRSYISGEEQFTVYQQFVNEQQTQAYIQKLLQLSSEQLKNLNGNSTLKEDIQSYSTITILVAKSKRNMQIGIGIFHKEYTNGEYICDYILSHKMSDFLTLIFNFSRFIYEQDKAVNKIEYLFDLKFIEDQQTLLHFLQFQTKCRRLGQVYVKTKNSKERKYILKRALFQEFEEAKFTEGKGVELNLKLLVFDELMMQINQGYHNKDNINYSSINVILAYYLSKNKEELEQFKGRAEHELNYRELLVTALLFNKKELDIKSIEQTTLGRKMIGQEISKISDKLQTRQVGQIQVTKMQLSQKLPSSIKRCTLEVNHDEIKYLVYQPEQAVTRVQSSNSSEPAYFLGLIPKYKIMVIEAQQFLTMSGSNPDLTIFFYIKHYVKNIVDVKKEVYERVYLPQMNEEGNSLFRDVSKRLRSSVILEESMRIGWKESISNSLIFTPKHRDLVIQKPFIVAVLSGVVERAVEGSPIYVRLMI